MQTKKRKPFTDLTNTYNLIPTSTLRKLVAASSDKSSFRDPPLSILKSNSRPTNQKCSGSSNRSDTSVGSSNVSALKNSRTVQFRSPPREISSITSLGGPGSKDAARNSRQVAETSKKGREAAVVIVSSPTPAEKRKDKGKAIDVPFSSPPPDKRKDKGKAITVPFSSPPPEKMNNYQNAYHASSLEREKQNGKANLSLFDVVKDSDEGILKTYSSSYGKTRKEDKGKAIDVPFSSPPLEKMNNNQNAYHASSLEREKQKGKANLSLFDVVKDSDEGILKTYSSSYGKARKEKDKGKAIDVPYSSPPPEKMNNNQNAYHASSLEREKQKGKANLSLFDVVKDSDEGIIKTYSSSYGKTRKEKDKGKAIAIPFSSPPPEKRKDKGKAIAVPFSSPPPEKMNNNQNAYHASPLERENQNGKANLSLFDIVKDSDDGILKTYSSSYAKTRKGKAILNSSGCARVKHEGIGNSITDCPSCSLEKRNDEKNGILKHSGTSTLKMENIANEFVNPSNFIFERTKEKGKPISPFNSSHEKARDKGKAILQPSDVVEITKDKWASAAVTVNSRPPRRKSEKRKNDAGASSCPPMKRTTNIQIDLDEVGDSKSSKSWTGPNPKSRKKRCSSVESTHELPLDFIKQQREYFKEVDEFELLVEEASEDELE